jgi:hypothetical protein
MMTLFELSDQVQVVFKVSNRITTHAHWDGQYVYVSPAMWTLIEGAAADDQELADAGEEIGGYERLSKFIKVLLRE